MAINYGQHIKITTWGPGRGEFRDKGNLRSADGTVLVRMVGIPIEPQNLTPINKSEEHSPPGKEAMKSG